MKHFSDEDLIKEIRNNSQVAFTVLMKRYERLVYRIGFSYTWQPEFAMDITQTVFFKIYQKLDLFNGTGSFKAWLLKIAHNESAGWLRINIRYKNDVELTHANIPEHEPDQENKLNLQQQRELLNEYFLKLNPKQRAALSLRYFEDMSIKEIADVLNCTDGTVKNILFRGLEKLRNRLTLKRRDKHG